MNILESISASFILKIESLKSILHILKPRFTADRLTDLINDIKINTLLTELADYSKFEISTNNTNINTATCITLLQKNVLAKYFISLDYHDLKYNGHTLEDRVLNYVYNYQIDLLDVATYNTLLCKLNHIETNFNHKIAILINDAICASVMSGSSKFIKSEKSTRIIIEKYNRYVLRERLPSRIQDIFFTIINILEKIGTNTMFNITVGDTNYEIIKNNIRKFNTYSIKIYPETVKNDKCDICDVKYIIDYEKNELYCKSCGAVSHLSEELYDSNFGLLETKQKNSTYDASNHCEFWFKRIFALEPTDMDESILLSVRQWLIKNNYPITCKYIRKALQKLKLTNFNTHVSLIRKLLTGKVPEPPTYDQKMRIFNYFNKAVKAYNNFYKTTHTNNNIKYYPYFIWKIIEIIYDDQHKKRHEIFECIHLQNLDTLKKNDKIWKNICNEIPEFKFKPTDRNEQYMFS